MVEAKVDTDGSVIAYIACCKNYWSFRTNVSVIKYAYDTVTIYIMQLLQSILVRVVVIIWQ